ncbi:MAG: TetR/AcrR family transcriptional regulator [Solirubrobacteraceae bacterium]|nr:TetR/AcrR family transcriptional regulator [Solirubrobacteraceae bacterium]
MTMAARRRQEREIVDAARALFDERGAQDAPVEEIARLAGINKALIYRHFASKEELFVLTATRYLDELAASLAETDAGAPPRERLVACAERFADYGIAHPAFLDCCLSLMRRPAGELVDVVSEGVLLRLGLAMSECVGVLVETIRAGVRQGDFAVEDPELAANLLWGKALGALQLARLGVGVARGEGGLPRFFAVPAEAVRAAVVADALASVGA